MSNVVIRTNVQSLTAHRNIKNTGLEQRRAANRLSSGYRVNSAADDAAGLAISESMRAQIRGLQQAERNTQDGVALLQTAEGAMQEINEMVHRIRELAVQAANDTNTTENRAMIQEEVNQLLLEIDSIANRVRYNSMPLISHNGSLTSGVGGADAVEAALKEWIAGSWIQDALTKIATQTGLQITANTSIRVVFSNDMPPGVGATMSGPLRGTEYTLTINSQFIGNSTAFGPSGPDIGGGMFFDRLITHEIMHLLEFQNFNTILPYWFSEGLAEAVHGAGDVHFGNFSNLAAVTAAVNAVVANPNTFGAHVYNGGYLAIMYLNAAHPGALQAILADMANAPQSNFEAAFMNVLGMTSTQFLNDLQTAAANPAAFLNTLGITPGSGNAYSLTVSDSATNIIPNGGAPVGGMNIGSTHSFTDANSGFMVNISFDGDGLLEVIESFTNLGFQIGANSNQRMEAGIPGMSRANLFGAGRVSVMSSVSASISLEATDNALFYVTNARARLGAYINRLEFTARSLAISTENLSDAESRIRDADMAKEMMSLTMSNILQQAGISALSQANQQPQNLLALFR